MDRLSKWACERPLRLNVRLLAAIDCVSPLAVHTDRHTLRGEKGFSRGAQNFDLVAEEGVLGNREAVVGEACRRPNRHWHGPRYWGSVGGFVVLGGATGSSNGRDEDPDSGNCDCCVNDYWVDTLGAEDGPVGVEGADGKRQRH